MTIIAASRRADFAVIVADRLWHNDDGDTGVHTKVAWHPTLPIAVATAGFRGLGERRAVDVLAEEVRAIARPEELSLESVRQRIADRCLETVRAQRRADPGRTAEDRAKRILDIYVGLVSGERAGLGRIRLTNTIEADPGPAYLTAPGHVGVWLERQGMTSDAWLDGDTGWGPAQLARRLADTLRAAIQFDRQSGILPTIGFPLDVLIVLSQGVRAEVLDQ